MENFRIDYSLSKKINVSGKEITVYRVFYPSGQRGGWVEGTRNISGNGRVLDDAIACGNSVVKDNAVIREDAFIGYDVILQDDSRVGGRAILRGSTRLTGGASARGGVKLNSCEVNGNVELRGEMELTELVIHSAKNKLWTK